MKKKFLIIILATAMFGITACGEGGSKVEQLSEYVDREEKVDGTVEALTQTEVSMEELQQHEETPAEDFEYSLLEGFVYIRGYHGTDNLVVIPETIEGMPVTIVDGLSGSGIAGIKFADSVESIGESCFFKDESIQYVIFGQNVKAVGAIAFELCINLKEIQLNQGLETVGEGALWPDSEALADLYIPQSVVEIGEGAIPMDGTTTIHVEAGSFAEQYCIKNQEAGFPELVYVVE